MIQSCNEYHRAFKTKSIFTSMGKSQKCIVRWQKQAAEYLTEYDRITEKFLMLQHFTILPRDTYACHKSIKTFVDWIYTYLRILIALTFREERKCDQKTEFKQSARVTKKLNLNIEKGYLGICQVISLFILFEISFN